MLIGRRLANETLTSEPISSFTSTQATTSQTNIDETSNPQHGVGVSRSYQLTAPTPTPTPSTPLFKPHSPSSRAVTITSREFRVSYTDIMRQVPEIHREEEWDVVLHLGVAMGYKECTLETGSGETGAYPGWSY
jgi:hypothetical protein